MVRMRIVWTRSAVSELEYIYKFYKRNASVSVARNLKLQLFTSVKQLENHPFSGPIEENLIGTKYEYRYLVEGNYKIIYRCDDNIVYITDVFDCRRDPQKMQNLYNI